MKTSGLIGPALDWAVAKACYTDGRTIYTDTGIVLIHTAPDSGIHFRFSPSIDWSQGGPIIEREKINIRDEVTCWSSWMWDSNRCGDVSYYGPTPLIAAMRCYVASKLGDEVDVPEELT
jgi:hypothetical protein